MRILLADDHPLFAEALRTLIERNFPECSLTVVVNLPAAHHALADGAPYDLAIVDLYMPGTQGMAGIEETLARFPETKLVLVSGAATQAEILRSIRLGAKGFLPKTLAPTVFAAALQVVMAGGTYVPTEYVEALADRKAPPTIKELTSREAEVLALLATGRANKEIGRELDLQEITVKLHLRNIFRKLGVRNRVEAANAARHLGLPQHDLSATPRASG